MKPVAWISLLLIVLSTLIAPYGIPQSSGAAQTSSTGREAAIQKLKDSVSGRGHVKKNRATGVVDFVRLDRGVSGGLVSSRLGTQKEKSLAFLRAQHDSFGLTDPDSQLRLTREQRDPDGGLHQTFNQFHNGVPVFAGVLKTHFNSAAELHAVNGVIVPDVELSTIPSRTSEEAAAFALAKVQSDSPNASGLTVRGSKLYIYRTGLAQGVAGENHLVWEIELSNNRDTREFVYVDAHSGKFVDQITGVYDALDRRVYDGQNLAVFPPPGYPSNPFWEEGQQFPTGITNADEVITASKETYDLFKNAFGRDSFDDLGSTMFAIFDSEYVSGNALASPILHLTVFSRDLTTDDVIAHEWTHIYTYYTHGLIYQWQPGALNEAYSDIFGETVDLLNGRGLDAGSERQVDDCFRPRPTLHVNSPLALQGDYVMAPALFGPPFGPSGISANIVLVDDGSGARTDACQTPFRNAADVRGRIALIDRSDVGTCTYSQKVKNAQLNGAIGVIVANDPPLGDDLTVMFGIDSSVTIPSGLIGYTDGQALRSRRANTVNVTITGEEAGNSLRWLIAEDSPYGGVRDMWNPRCFANPARVSDREYFCGTFDNGGVHLNSGVPNHGYTLLVDGGTYNNQTIARIGLTKAAHIYFRAMALYQTPTSDFADHAEALEASASDLVGVNLPDLLTGLPSGEEISLFDVDQVHKATVALELRNPPTQCGFKPLLATDPPADNCPAPQNVQATIFSEDFESDPTATWIVSRDVGSSETFTPRDWQWVQQMPAGRSGSGFFGPDPLDDCISASPGEAGVLHLDSPLIILPRVMIGGPHLSFDHYVATEAGFDGGQLMISVNDGPFRLVDPSAFIYNPYNARLFPVVAGFEQDANPRAGQPAFSGANQASFKGSWGTSIVDLTGYAHSRDRIRLRWDLSTDFCFGTNSGWYLDNVRVYACQP